ncbi:MAG: aminotransferase class V-fold PLP-dependent enzyme [candidate division Zixibacteria bacterium]|jgi:cysteine desulfurase|nr:aminotransferase class V-fold PLP-dependent enzyme [candidate division Zixibacteria bacterium]
MDPIYLDHNATTPVAPEVVEAMLPYLDRGFGNASSVHAFGREAKVALETAREQIAAFIRCEPSELYFTSGGTESDNMAVLGVARYLKHKRNHIIVGATEHHAVIEPAEYLHKKEGFELHLAPVDSEGFVSPVRLRGLVKDTTALVSIMHANNETGTVQADLSRFAQIAHEKGALFHTDAVQSIGKVEVDVKELGVDLLSLTGHKIYGPKGCGALFVRSGLKIDPLLHGGSHEKRRRPGTENVAGAVGLAKALELAERMMDDDYARLSDLADFFIDRVLRDVPDVRFNGTRTSRIPQTMNFAFNGVEGESVVLSLDVEGVAVSSGSACTSGAIEASHVLTAMGIDPIVAHGSVRFSLGRSTTREQLDYVLTKLPPIVDRLRAMSPVYKKQV